MILSSAVREQRAAPCRPRVPRHLPLQHALGSRPSLQPQQTCSRAVLALPHPHPLRHRCQAGAAAATEPAPVGAESPLEAFLGWCIANGVEGVGGEEDKAGVFEGEHGERGLACLQDIDRGELVLRVPLRLAVTEHPSDEESNALVYAGAPWSVRLAAKLLRLRAAGAASPWYPYLQVLPASVPAPGTVFGWEEIQAIQYGPMLRDLDHASWLGAAAARALSPEAAGGAGREELEWALSIVHSRSFGSPGEGGAAVRMLVPLIDFLNHAGDEWYPGGTGGLMESAPRDNVRWDIQAPAEGEGGEWHMAVTATRDIQAGEELLLSYGERSNDDFFLHYGFVPPRNPHDDCTLWDSIEDAVAWLCAALAGQDPSDPSLATTAAEALEAAGRYTQPLGPAPAPTSDAESEIMAREAARVKLLAGARLDGRLMAAFEVLAAAGLGAAADSSSELSAGEGESKGWSMAVAEQQGWAMAQRQRRFHAAIAQRCQQMLVGMPSSLLEDLAAVAAWEGARGGEEGAFWAGLEQQYRLEVEAYCRQAGTDLADPFGLAAATAAEAGAGAEASGSSGSEAEGAVVDAGAGALGGDEELLALLRQAGGPLAAAPEEEAAAEATAEQQPPSMLPVVFRAYKKMILWDAVLAAAAAAATE